MPSFAVPSAVAQLAVTGWVLSDVSLTLNRADSPSTTEVSAIDSLGCLPGRSLSTILTRTTGRLSGCRKSGHSLFSSQTSWRKTMTSSSVSSSSAAWMLTTRSAVGPVPWGLNSHPTEGDQETVSSVSAASSTRRNTHHPQT